jgi:hypothetical protein
MKTATTLLILCSCVSIGIGHGADVYPAYRGQYASGNHCTATYTGVGPTTLTCNYQTACRIQDAPNEAPYYQAFYASAGIAIGFNLYGQPSSCHVTVTASTSDDILSEYMNYQWVPGIEALAQASWFYGTYFSDATSDLVYCNGDENYSAFVPEPC